MFQQKLAKIFKISEQKYLEIILRSPEISKLWWRSEEDWTPKYNYLKIPQR